MILENIIVASFFIATAFLFPVIACITGAVKKRKVIKPMEYVPPPGASPVDFLIQYYGASAEPREIFNPLMLYWAERGFITVEEDCKRGLKLTKIKDLERPKSKDGFNPDTFEIENKLFETLFKDGDDVFYTLAAQGKFKSDYESIMSDCKKQAKKITDGKSRKIKIASLIVSFATLLIIVAVVGIATENKGVIICIFPCAAILMAKLAFGLSDRDGGIPKGSSARFMLVPFFCMFGGVPMAAGFMFLPVSAAAVLLSAILFCAVTVFFVSEKIDIRDGAQLKFYARICGFKQFLLLAEKSKLEMLVEEDPRYFYNILPYCYVLDITEKLKPKFDRIALDGPAWYLGELRETLMF